MAIGSEEFDVSSMVDSAASSMKLDDVDETPEIEPVEQEPLEESDAPAEEPVEETEETGEPEGEEQPQARQAPKSWSKEQHAVWSKLPSEAQNYIEVREKQMLDGIEEYKEFAHYGRELNNVINPYMPMFEAANVDIKTGVQYLLNAQYLLQHGSLEQKTSELKRIAEQYGVNFRPSKRGPRRRFSFSMNDATPPPSRRSTIWSPSARRPRSSIRESRFRRIFR